MYRACKFLAEIVPRFVEMKKSEPNNQAKIETKDWTELARAVRKIALNKRFAAFDRRRQVADLVVKELRANGQFCRTLGDRLFYLSLTQRRLLDLEQRPFARLVKTLSGLGATESAFRFALDRVQTLTVQSAAVEVHTLSHYDTKSGLLAVSDGGGGIWVRERGAANGTAA